MAHSNLVTQFLQTVCSAVHWKKAHSAIVRELSDHIADQKEAYIASGMPPEEAEQEAVHQMGDPQLLGRQFDAVYRPRTHWSLLLCILLLLVGGVFLRFLLPGVQTSSRLIGTIVGLALAAAAYYTDFRFLCARWVMPVYLLCLLLCGWQSVRINGTSFAVSHLLLLAPLPLCGCIYRCKGAAWRGLLECMAAAVLPFAASLLLESSPAALVMSGATCFLLLAWAAGCGWFSLPRWQSLPAILIPALLAGVWIVVSFSHRLLPVLFPALDPQGAGFSTLTVRSLLSGAQWIGPSAAFAENAAWIPTYHYSFLLTWLIARYGWISLFPVCALFLWLIVHGALLARAQNSFFAKLVSAAALCIFSLQVLAYISANCGLLFTVYFPLPLLSGGNYSMLVNLPLLGILLSVLRHGSLYTDTVAAPRLPLFTYSDGVLTLRLK